ncbi:DUF6541 family protein [Pseudactinotalea suaedae]|uniref:DUF6541 family protein n=1 Tax=Pseudactinotalea suaedae TaxID=1524924 RepID=UPI0012E0FDE0|nr:DUF6541 family protein [Pseudactinotalea suaedae]
MTETSPAVALAATLLALALLVAPGWLLLHLVRIRGLLAAALAPACSTAVLGCGAILAQLAGVRWSLVAALGAAAAGAVLALVVRRFTSQAPESPRASAADVALIGAGLLLAVVPALLSTGSLDAYLQRWDAVFHLAALRFIEDSGSASSLTLGALSYGDGGAALYPAGWHALGSLLPGSPTAALTIGASVTAALPWVLGCAVLAAELTRVRARPFLGAGVAGVAGLLAGLVTAAPMSLWIGWGHVPNAAGLAMLPGALALGLRLVRAGSGRPAGVIALLVALLGMGLAHPNTVLAAGALLLPALAGAVLRAIRAPASASGRTRAALAPGLAVVVVVGVLAAFLLSPVAAAVTGYASSEIEPVGTAALDAVTGWYRLWPSWAGVAVAVLALIGVALALRQGRRMPAAVLLVAWLLYIDAATGGHLQISRLWYTSPARLSVVVTAVVVPLAAGTLVAAGARWRDRFGTVAAALGATVLLLAITVPSVAARTPRTANVFDDSPGNPPQFVTSGELEMIETLPDLLDGALLGSPFSGAASAYGLAGVPVTFPVAGQVWSSDQRLVMENLDQLEAGQLSSEVCEALDRLDIRYLYQDTEPYQADNRYEPLDRMSPAGATVVAEADTARVLDLPTCRDQT